MEAVLGILMPFTTAILIIAIIYAAKVSKDRSRNRLIEKAIEHGTELSPDLFKPAEKVRRPSDLLTGALVSIGIGVGLFAAFYFFFGGLKFAAFGFIPLFIGIGQLVAYFINKNQHKTV